jgi:hypothetical protein
MDALRCPWELYLPEFRQFYHAEGRTPPGPNELFVRLDARATPLLRLADFKNLKGVWIGAAAQSDLEVLAAIPSLTSVRLVNPRITSLAPLSGLSHLEALSLDDPPTLNELDGLGNLKCLVLRHFRRVRSLSLVGALSRLRMISMSTIPSWDASRRCLEVESFEPLSKLHDLEWLYLMGVMPLDRQLVPLHGLDRLKDLQISHVFKFELKDYAALARALPKTSGHCLQPYYTLPQLNLRCKRCGEEKVFLTGPRPRTRRQLCPKCDGKKLQEHQMQWDAALKNL